jgi:hypothetical protein
MNTLSWLRRGASIALLAILGFAMPSCGGGGGSNPGGGGGPIIATFNAANPNPVANTISMAGTAAGSNFSVVVRVTDVTNFYGASFRISFTPATAQFVDFTSNGSVLLNQGSATDFRAQLVPGNNGQLDVVATLQAQVQGVNVAGTQTLITLNFRATAVTSSNPFAFVADPTREARTCPAPPGACQIVTGNLTWSGGTLIATQ